MELSIILTITAFVTSPDLCADVHLDATGQPYMDSIGQTLPRYCKWTGPNVPVLNTDVCCDISDGVAACVMPDQTGGCSLGAPYYCKYGQVIRNGVICYRPFPDACASGFCVQPPELPPPTEPFLACCSAGGVCQEIDILQGSDCFTYGGTILACVHGVLNDDGTMACFDQ
jgi:hypothetical protein